MNVYLGGVDPLNGPEAVLVNIKFFYHPTSSFRMHKAAGK